MRSNDSLTKARNYSFKRLFNDGANDWKPFEIWASEFTWESIYSLLIVGATDEDVDWFVGPPPTTAPFVMTEVSLMPKFLLVFKRL